MSSYAEKLFKNNPHKMRKIFVHFYITKNTRSPEQTLNYDKAVTILCYLNLERLYLRYGSALQPIQIIFQQCIGDQIHLHNLQQYLVAKIQRLLRNKLYKNFNLISANFCTCKNLFETLLLGNTLLMSLRYNFKSHNE